VLLTRSRTTQGIFLQLDFPTFIECRSRHRTLSGMR